MNDASSSAADATLRTLLDDGVILCLRFRDGSQLVDACRAAARGGLRVLEITLTSPGALDAIRELSSEPDLLVGAGTVLTVADVEAVAAAGGRFALSPVFDPVVVEEAGKRGLLAIPGASTPTEILAAHAHGAPVVKVFPAAALGGPAYLRAIRGPIGHVPMIPTSGPTSESMAEWFDAGAAAVGVGLEVFPPEGFTMESVEAAARRVRASVDEVRAARTA